MEGSHSDHGGWHLLRCRTDGAQRCNRSRSTRPFLGYRPLGIRLLLCLFLHHFSIHPRYVLARHPERQRCAGHAIDDIVDLAIVQQHPRHDRLCKTGHFDRGHDQLLSFLDHTVGQYLPLPFPEDRILTRLQPLLLIPPTKLRWLFVVKLVAAPITAIATLAWCVHKAGGSGSLFNQPPKVHGSQYAYLWLSCMSAVTGSWATLACNIPDFSRYARSSKGQYIQLPFLPIIFTVCGVLGIVTTSATQELWDGTPLWNPLDIIAHWQAYGSSGRAAAFFAALAWYIAQVGTNITANSISAANDLTVLFPRWVNIYRGCIIAAIVGGWVIVPWKILNSATTFLAFMGGYSVFLAPMAGKSTSNTTP